MDRERAINTIRDLFPADAPWSDTASIGQELLMQAISQQWRSLPDDILLTYANLCIREEQRQATKPRGI